MDFFFFKHTEFFLNVAGRVCRRTEVYSTQPEERFAPFVNVQPENVTKEVKIFEFN